MENKVAPSIDEILISGKKEKEIVKPFRKYQLTILALVILMTILGYYLYSLNKDLNYYMKQHKNLYEQLYKEDKKAEDLNEIFNRVEVNYKCLYELDKTLNIDTIKDLDELDMMNNWIAIDKEVQYSICYKATYHGDSAVEFRNKCEGISPLLVIIETVDGYRFGGYTTQSFSSEGIYKEDHEAFIFSFDTKKKYKVKLPEKAVGDFTISFPYFGQQDIILHPGFFNNSSSYTQFPYTYEKDPDSIGDYILTGGIKHFKVKEVEICSVYINLT